MRFHALLAIRDEADIIGQSLQHMLKWADTIFVFDTGSVDETWEIVQEAAAADRRVRPLNQDAVVFDDSLVRGWLFDKARKEMEEGDWFLRVDADEFHHVTPPEFVRTRLSKHETVVWHQYYDFRLLESEVTAWRAGKETVADRQRPIADRRRWFTVSSYSEPRLCRYRSTMRWPKSASFPINAGFVARERLPVRHYLHRDPPQLNKRCKIRALTVAVNGSQLFTDFGRADAKRLRSSLAPNNSTMQILGGDIPRTSLDHEWWRFITPDNTTVLHYREPGTP
jgi:glycosyltransferase involved in cell wall biosynthesis